MDRSQTVRMLSTVQAKTVSLQQSSESLQLENVQLSTELKR